MRWRRDLIFSDLFVVGPGPVVAPALPSQGRSPRRRQAPRPSRMLTTRLAEAKRLNEEVEQLYGQGRYREATAKARQALAIRKAVLGERHPDTA